MRDFARYIIATGAATEAQVDAALDRQRALRPPIGRVALNKGLLDSSQIFSILAYQARNPTMRFGEAAIALGMLAPRHIEELLWDQRVRTMPVEDLLVRAGVMDEPTARGLRASFDEDAPVASVPRPHPSGSLRLGKRA
jgi:hypothetical protein